MNEALRRLVDILTLEKIDENLYRGDSEYTDWGRVYGGQVLAQALSAAKQQVAKDREIHSFHSYFLRPGNTDFQIIYHVETMLDAGTISNRRVTATQRGEPIFVMTASFQVPLKGFEHENPMPQVVSPDDLPSIGGDQNEEEQHGPQEWQPKFSAPRAIDFRLAEDDGCEGTKLWMKPRGVLPNCPEIHQYLLAYASDFFFLRTAAECHNISFREKGLRMATIDHSMWYHQPFNFSDWLLYDMHSPSASNGRGFVLGHIYNRDGELVASAAQEGIMRISKSAK